MYAIDDDDDDDDNDDDDEDDNNEPVWPTWAVGALFRSVRCTHIYHVCVHVCDRLLSQPTFSWSRAERAYKRI